METSLYCLQCFKLQNYIFFFKYRKQAKENILLYIYNVQVLHNLNHAWYKKKREIPPAYTFTKYVIILCYYHLLSKASTAFAFAASTSAFAFALAASTSA